jgi:hypothetical protein
VWQARKRRACALQLRIGQRKLYWSIAKSLDNIATIDARARFQHDHFLASFCKAAGNDPTHYA